MLVSTRVNMSNVKNKKNIEQVYVHVGLGENCSTQCLKIIIKLVYLSFPITFAIFAPLKSMRLSNE